LQRFSDIVVVKVPQFPHGINALDVDDAVVGSVVESDSAIHGPELVSSHLGCLLLLICSSFVFLELVSRK
jgi:hypothetical protein